MKRIVKSKEDLLKLFKRKKYKKIFCYDDKGWENERESFFESMFKYCGKKVKKYYNSYYIDGWRFLKEWTEEVE